ncbi:ABCB family ABC transporter ATP-binding protein/permease [Phenylobacterium sp. 58.2.17]|uniref:ABCB family ABC transporter ATP-binding protein/permease n=1 Tax=Phenylobacterium sp. 58.2.17 TaxID=2969306 RepID=UPI00226495C5|nr:ABC transporter ATP-binding protein/permease [Phenylobacterium sp. 58.2.17]MCX7584799.1 ABC transporter ATP-binding protein/permease [Phenylobacterium sp. 58.2.17]
MTPAMAARRQAVPDAIAPASVKFDFWRSMRDLAALVMRSGAPGLRWRVAASLALVFAGKAAGVAAPVALGDAINRLAPGAGQAAQLGVDFLLLALAFAGLRLVAACAPNLRDMIFTVVAQSTMAKAATETFAHTLALGLDYHQGKQTGSLARVIDRGARSTDFLMRSVVFNLGPTAIELVLAMAVMAMRLDWRFAATAFVTIVLYAMLTFKITDWRLSHRRELNEADSRSAGLSVDALLNYETVKTFGSEDRTVDRYEAAMADYVRAGVRANASLAMLNAVQALVLNLGLALMTVMAGYEVMNGRMRIGDVTMAILLLIGIYGPLNMLGFNYREIRQAFIDMEQMVQLRAVKPDIVDAPDARPLPPASGRGAEIVFEDVEFRHDARSTGLIDVSFRAAPGATVALVGPSGAGKTTAIRLALRLIDPQSGAITLDGVDLRQVRQSSLRQAIALVPQDVALFNDTMAANIAFARPAASTAEIRAAAEAAELGGFIDSLPNGLATRVGERGLKLSGGERQRVGIARALLADPRLLILDEATSALDGPTEAAIQETLRKVRAGRTTLVIAHRLSTIVDADLILVLRRGRIVERGRHAELLEKGGEYAALWRRQTREA